MVHTNYYFILEMPLYNLWTKGKINIYNIADKQ